MTQMFQNSVYMIRTQDLKNKCNTHGITSLQKKETYNTEKEKQHWNIKNSTIRFQLLYWADIICLQKQGSIV